MNNFYASVECMLDLSLKGKPVAVGGDEENRHGIILAKNYEAKKFGVQTGEPLWQARRKCRDLVIVKPHYEQYLKYSELAHKIYNEYTDKVEPFGMDECWLDVTGSRLLKGDGIKIANEIRERIKRELGLTVSIGVSFNKVFAKLGSDMKKPDAVTVIDRRDFKETVWQLPVEELLGVGRASKNVLQSLGIKTIGELACEKPDAVKKKLGKCGTLLIRYAKGEDLSPVSEYSYEPPVKSVGHGITTREDLCTNGEVWNVMLFLTQDIAHKLRGYNKNASGVMIDIRNSALTHQQWQCKLTPSTSSAYVIAKTAYLLFERSYKWELPMRSVTVRAINLEAADEGEQLDMFTDYEKIEKRGRIEDAVENIRARYGKYSIMPAELYNKNSKMPTDRETELRMPTGMFG